MTQAELAEWLKARGWIEGDGHLWHGPWPEEDSRNFAHRRFGQGRLLCAVPRNLLSRSVVFSLAFVRPDGVECHVELRVNPIDIESRLPYVLSAAGAAFRALSHVPDELELLAESAERKR